MKKVLITAMLMFSGTTFADAPIEYVKICSLYGEGWYYIPGTNQCLQPTTGLIKSQDSDGSVIQSNSDLANRILMLETRLMALESN